ncbi:hypothetical protein MYX84_14215, partial [Acidobacteria bacterium AH-259-O06]|nr:hypothetical protein [Acidobacteria bacterium AH-259-O06]
ANCISWYRNGARTALGLAYRWSKKQYGKVTPPAAHREVFPSVEHRTRRYENNRAEVSHQHTRE